MGDGEISIHNWILNLRGANFSQIPNLAHFHPSVAVFAANLTKPAQKVAKPDLDSHSLIRFLDKFVYRNPKATDSARGASIMQPLRSTKDLGDIWLGTRAAGLSAPVNSAAFMEKKSEDIAAEDAFFHEYFSHMAKDSKEKKKQPKTSGEDDDDEEGAEDEIWKALVSSRADIEDDASDVGFDDLDEEDMASDDGSEPALSLDSDDMGDDDEDDDDMEGVEFNDFSDDDDEEAAAADELVEAPEEAKEEETEKDKRKSRRKQLKSLPMFASADDYAELLAKEEDDL